jgi:Ribbon-helix-helix domain
MAHSKGTSMAGKKSSASSKLRLIKIPVQAYLEPAQAAELRALSERTRVPAQAYIREGIDVVLAKYRKGAK